jgi:hypothetical protein
MIRPFLYCCPTTGQNVQGIVEGQAPPEGGGRVYEAIECPACRSMHLVDLATLTLPVDAGDRS